MRLFSEAKVRKIGGKMTVGTVRFIHLSCVLVIKNNVHFIQKWRIIRI